MTDQYVEVTKRGWRQRMGGSIKGIVVGLLLAALGVWLLFWNEGRAVHRAKALQEGASTVVAVDGTAPQSANEGRLVHFMGEADAETVLRDALFGVEVQALKLERAVEMYQWREERQSEEKKKLGGGTETVTTYTYSTDWSSQAIDSTGFKQPEGHQNQPFPFAAETWIADPIMIGDWIMSPTFVAKLNRREQLAVGEEARRRAGDRVRDRLRLDQGGFYLGGDPLSPRLGDVRVRFHQVPAAMVSVVGRQQAGELVPYTARVGGDIALLTHGLASADDMFVSAKRGNRTMTWILRVVGFLLIAMGFSKVLKPLSVLADVVPMIGNLVERGTGMISFVLAALVSLVTVAIGWIFYRPLLALVLLATAGALLLWLVKRFRGQPAARSAPPPPPPPPTARPTPPPPPEAPPRAGVE